MTGTPTTYQERWNAALMNNYGTPALELVTGSGAEVWDADGRHYLDLVSGVAVNALGHAHPAVVAAVTDQIGPLGHVSNFFVHEPVLNLAERLQGLLEAPDSHGAVLQLRRRGERDRVQDRPPDRPPAHRRRAERLPRTHAWARWRSPASSRSGRRSSRCRRGVARALRRRRRPGRRVDGDTAAVVLEPILGEAGVIVPPRGLPARRREITAARGALLVIDEVQTGIGRTGAGSPIRPPGSCPDVVTLAKGLGGGLPIGACIGIGDAGRLLEPGQHGTTFGGNPVCCAAALAVLDTIVGEGLLEHVQQVGKVLATGIEALGHPLVTDVSGAGLMIGVGLASPVVRGGLVGRPRRGLPGQQRGAATASGSSRRWC